MDRRSVILGGISKREKGIEVAPWFAPIAPKWNGYDCLALDVFDTETLKQRAVADKNINPATISSIEPVDLVGNAIDIAELVSKRHSLGAFDYVVSSHNFEHLPDPIRFLQGCSKVLKPGGIVTMAVPDHRACFDFFRPHTLVHEWLEAHIQCRRRPTPTQVLATSIYFAKLQTPRHAAFAFSITDDPAHVSVVGDLQTGYRQFVEATSSNSDEYADAHCTVMSPRSLELLLIECRQLGLLSFRILEISQPVGCEFFVRLQTGEGTDCGPMPLEDFATRRTQLLHAITNENAAAYQLRSSPSARLTLARSLSKMHAIGSIASRVIHDPRGALKAMQRRIQK